MKHTFLKNLWSKILIAAMAVFSAFSPVVASALSYRQVFNDVNQGTHYVDAIYWAYDNGIISGYGNNLFGPDNCVRRAELLKMIINYHFPGPVGSFGSEPSFFDVRKTDWFYLYVKEGKNRGLIQGYSDGSFKPNACVNRAEAMKIAYGAFAPANTMLDTSSSIIHYDDKLVTDVRVGVWYAPYARFFFENRLVGTDHTTYDTDAVAASGTYSIKFYPAESMTRKEVAEMLYRVSRSPAISKQI